MGRALAIGLLAIGLGGCSEEGMQQFRANQDFWWAYRTSPAWHQRHYSATVKHNDGSETTCYAVCDRYDCATTCYGP